MTPVFLSAVEERFALYMEANHPTVNFYFDNTNTPDDLAMYVVFHSMPSEDVLPINFGVDAKSRNVGLIQVDVVCAKDIGAGAANSLANLIGKAFKRANITTVEGLITFKDHSVRSLGSGSGKHKEQMRIPYRYDFKDT